MAVNCKWWHFVPSVLVLIGITVLSLIQVSQAAPSKIPMADKWGHMLAYLVLAMCMASDGYHAHLPIRRVYIAALIFPIAYGGLLELIQPLFPPRACELGDLLADSIGTVLGVALYVLFRYCYDRKQTRQQTENLQ